MRPIDKAFTLQLNIDGSQEDSQMGNDHKAAPSRRTETVAVEQVFARPDTLKGVTRSTTAASAVLAMWDANIEALTESIEDDVNGKEFVQ
ncbi:MAG: hypothetical protein ACE14L_06020 [Terriglobales bacterium]